MKLNESQLRKLVRLIMEEDILDEDECFEEEDEIEEISTIAGGAIEGSTGPLGTGPTYPADVKKRTKKKKVKESMDRNQYPGRDSNWHRFAQILDIGILDLDHMAGKLGYSDFGDMDMSVTPASLLSRDPKNFVNAVYSIPGAFTALWTRSEIERAAT